MAAINPPTGRELASNLHLWPSGTHVSCHEVALSWISVLRLVSKHVYNASSHH
jgi:hypothetical protein